MTSPTLTFGVGIPAPEPGYYPGVPADVYHAWDACSQSRLKLLHKKSPAHLRSHIIEGSAETDALRFGSAAHMAILEPELFGVRYKPKTQCTAFTGKDERCRNVGSVLLESDEIVCRTHLREQPVNTVVELMSVSEFETCKRMREVVGRKLRASRLTSGEGEFELSIVWDETVTVMIDGELREVIVRCKARVDRFSPRGAGTLVDLKTTEDASHDSFERAIFRYGYHIQGAFNLRGAHATGLPARHFTILAAEKKAPYEMAVYRLGGMRPSGEISSGALEAGEEMALGLLKLYARCKATDNWPGYPDRIQDIALPNYAWKATDDDLNELEDVWDL